MERESAVELATSNIRYGAGVTREIGLELADQRVRHVALLTDANLAGLPPVQTVRQALEDEKIAYSLFDAVRGRAQRRILSGSDSLCELGALRGLRRGRGGSTIDTAKAANLYSSYPADFLDYVNPPIGKGLPIPGSFETTACRSDDRRDGK